MEKVQIFNQISIIHNFFYTIGKVFFIDIGSKQEISLKNIYKLPTKCTNLSSQCILLKVTNLNRNLKCNDLDLLPNMMMAKVM